MSLITLMLPAPLAVTFDRTADLLSSGFTYAFFIVPSIRLDDCGAFQRTLTSFGTRVNRRAILDSSPPEARLHDRLYCNCGFLRNALRSAVLTRNQVSRPSRTIRIGTSAPAGPLAHSLR